jgi:hypothetical protein
MKIKIMYDVVTSFVLTVERDELPEDHDELLESVTRAELADCPMEVHEIEWDNLKEAWRSSTSDNTTVMDEDESIDYYK